MVHLSPAPATSQGAPSAQSDEDTAAAAGAPEAASSGREQIRWITTYSKNKGIQSGYGFRLLETMFESVYTLVDTKVKEKNRLFPRFIKKSFSLKAPELVQSHPAIFEAKNVTLSVKIQALRGAAKKAYQLCLDKLPKNVTPTQREKVGQHKDADLEEPAKVVLKEVGLGPHGAQALNMLEVVGRYIVDVEDINEKSKAVADKNKRKRANGLAKYQEHAAAREKKQQKRLLDADVEEESDDDDEAEGDESQEGQEAASKKKVESQSLTSSSRCSPRDFATALASVGPSSMMKMTEISRRMDQVDASTLKTNFKMETIEANLNTVKESVGAVKESVGTVKVSLELAQNKNDERFRSVEDGISELKQGLSSIMNLLHSKLGN